MHLEVVTPDVRRRMMPGKAEVPVERYFRAFAAAVPVFGRGQVSTYILAGLGDTARGDPGDLRRPGRARRLSVRRAVRADLRHAARKPSDAVAPTSCTRSSSRSPRCSSQAGLKAADIKAGCGKCGACSALSTYEKDAVVMIVRAVRRLSARASSASNSPPRAGSAKAPLALRRQVFCEEQGLFGDDDRDAIDDYAIPIVALSMLGVAADQVVGTVRIHEEAPGVWCGSRLAVDRDYRRIGAIGATLIRLAVSPPPMRWAAGPFSPMSRRRTGRCFARCIGRRSTRSICTAGRI